MFEVRPQHHELQIRVEGHRGQDGGLARKSAKHAVSAFCLGEKGGRRIARGGLFQELDEQRLPGDEVMFDEQQVKGYRSAVFALVCLSNERTETSKMSLLKRFLCYTRYADAMEAAFEKEAARSVYQAKILGVNADSESASGAAEKFKRSRYPGARDSDTCTQSGQATVAPSSCEP